jgi:hypothetical protein
VYRNPPTVAATIASDLAAVQARRVGLGLLATRPLVGPTWLAAVAATGCRRGGADAAAA